MIRLLMRIQKLLQDYQGINKVEGDHHQDLPVQNPILDHPAINVKRCEIDLALVAGQLKSIKGKNLGKTFDTHNRILQTSSFEH